jgi:hypothetical protein
MKIKQDYVTNSSSVSFLIGDISGIERTELILELKGRKVNIFEFHDETFKKMCEVADYTTIKQGSEEEENLFEVYKKERNF